MTIPLSDYGKLHLSSAAYSVLRPGSVAAAVREWRAALAQGKALRMRGSGHGWSGASLPRNGETLVRTRGLDHYRVGASGQLTVGSGATLWDIRDFVADRGWRLPVYNGGWAGPSLGGFVNAGGVGGMRVPPHERGTLSATGEVGERDASNPVSLSELHGGIWANVARIRMIDGRGIVHDVVPENPDFPWIFASMGQFGLILEVTLRLLPQAGLSDGLPVGSAGRIPVSNPLDQNETDSPPPAGGMDWLYWFTALLPVAEEDAAWEVIGDWSRAHGEALRPSGGWAGPLRNGAPIGFRYLIRRKAPTPPLLYPLDEDFLTMGMMAVCGAVGTGAAEQALVRAEREFLTQIIGCGWSVYCQAENLTRSIDFRTYWGPERWDRFCELKDRFDPEDRINRGEVRPGDCPPPARVVQARKVAASVRRSLGLS